MVGCNNPLNKTILEELSVEELREIENEDPDFMYYYEILKDDNVKRFMSDVKNKVEFGDLTYKRLIGFMECLNDDALYEKIEKQTNLEWDNKIGRYINKMDSIIDFWTKFRNDNSLKDISIESVLYDAPLSEKDFFIYISSPRPIEKIHYRYIIHPKQYVSGEASLYDKRRIKKGEITQYSSSHSITVREGGGAQLDFWKHYDCDFVPLDYISNGIYYSSKMSEIPQALIDYFDEETISIKPVDIHANKELQAKIIRQFYERDFLDYDELLDKNGKEECKRMDSKCYAFVCELDRLLK